MDRTERSSTEATSTGAEPANSTGPVAILGFEGWNDAGDAASSAIEHLELTWDADPLAEIDPDPYYDFQVSRPHVKLIDGVTRKVTWPTTRLSVCRPPGSEHDVVLVHGIEPNMRWGAFCSELLGHLNEAGVRTVVSLGALLADAPHTRPVPVTGTAYDADSAARYGLERSRYEGPTGIVGIFQDQCVQSGIPSISFWAAVPHYVSQPPSPKATLALLHRVEEALDLEVPLGNLPDQAEEWETTVSEMAEEDEDVRNYVRALEEKKDMESRGRIENVQELKSNILGFLEQDPEDATLSGFLNEIALYTDLDSVEAGDDCVTMMTIHSAKGLEFPVVYVVGMEEGIFPGASAQYDQEELEEERRLFYVGATRARRQLVLLTCDNRFGEPSPPASFVGQFLGTPEWASQRPGTPGKAPAEPDAAAVAAWEKDYLPGTAVVHRAFGPGMVVSRSGAVAVIAFDEVGTKKVELTACLRKRLLRLASAPDF